MEHDWSALPTDVLETIARSYCTEMEDFIAFRGVCTSWRAAAAKDKFTYVSKVPLLMLSEKKNAGRTTKREFYSLSKRGICWRIHLPGGRRKRCNDVGFGWILTKSPSGEVCLMKPFSSAARIQLPNLKKFPNYWKHCVNPEAQFIYRAWLTANPSETSKFTLVVTGNQYLGFWSSGDESWTKKEGMRCSVLTCCKGKIYMLDYDCRLFVWDSLDFSKSHELVVPVKNGPPFTTFVLQDYMVGSSDGDELLFIRRNNHSGLNYAEIGANHFGVFKVDLVRGKLIKKKGGLGKDAVFLGDNAPVAVDATEFPGILKPNCIYFTDDCFGAYCNGRRWRKGGGKDMGVYNVENGSIERFDVDSLSHICPPMWVFPSF